MPLVCCLSRDQSAKWNIKHYLVDYKTLFFLYLFFYFYHKSGRYLVVSLDNDSIQREEKTLKRDKKFKPKRNTKKIVGYWISCTFSQFYYIVCGVCVYKYKYVTVTFTLTFRALSWRETITCVHNQSRWLCSSPVWSGGLGRENWSHRFSAIDSRRKFCCLDEQHGPNRLTTFRFFVCVFEMRFFFSNISRVLFF
jgi:hypothetical protein